MLGLVLHTSCVITVEYEAIRTQLNAKGNQHKELFFAFEFFPVIKSYIFLFSNKVTNSDFAKLHFIVFSFELRFIIA